jgi:TolB-like protein
MTRLLSKMFLVPASAAILAAAAGEIRAQDTTRIELQCPPNIVVPCNKPIDSTVTLVAANSSCGAVTLIYSDKTIPGAAPDLFTITRTWTATDTCGRKRTCEQTIQVVPFRPRIAVLPFENLAEAEDGARVFARLMQERLVQSPNLEVISLGEVETATLRVRIRLPVLMDNDQSQRLRQALNADYFVLGTILAYQTTADQYSGIIPVAGITLQLRDAVSGLTVWSETYHEIGTSGEWLFGLGVEHDITRLAHSICQQAAKKLNKVIKPVPCDTISR